MHNLTSLIRALLLATLFVTFVLAVPAPGAAPQNGPLSAEDALTHFTAGAHKRREASAQNGPLSAEDALAHFTAGPHKRRENKDGGNKDVKARTDGDPTWTGGKSEVIHFFNCGTRKDVKKVESDSLIVVCFLLSFLLGCSVWCVVVLCQVICASPVLSLSPASTSTSTSTYHTKLSQVHH